ncbi:MAG: hypothetical protein ABI321_20825 [Polyangia bacterium]
MLSLASAAVAAPSAKLFRSPDYRVVAVDPPTGWELAASPPSSRLLASWAHRDGAKLTLAAQRSALTDADKLFEQSKDALKTQGWSIGAVDKQSGRIAVQATLDHGRRIARQLYCVEEGFAYVLTMVAPAGQGALRARDFDDTVATMRLGAPTK